MYEWKYQLLTIQTRKLDQVFHLIWVDIETNKEAIKKTTRTGYIYK